MLVAVQHPGGQAMCRGSLSDRAPLINGTMVARPMKLPTTPASLFSAFDNVPLAACPVRARANLLTISGPAPVLRGF